MKTFFTLSLLIFTINLLYATRDTIAPKNIKNIPANIELKDFYDDLDSLLDLWYVKTSLQNLSHDFVVDTFDIQNDTIIPQFSDSIYEARLKKLHSIIPLTYNNIIRKFIELYTVKRRKQVSIMLGLSKYYFPIFENELDKNDLPVELKYMPVIESALNPLAKSRAGAVGIWQFMYSTAKLYNLKINSYIDERRDPYLSSIAAAQMLKELYSMYGDWLLVIAAYNCGPGNVNKAIRRAKGKKNFWDIYYFLPRETRGYVPAFIAAFYTFEYAQEHKIPITKIELPVANDTIMVKNYVHFGQISELLGIPIQQLRELNKQYRRDIIPGSSEKPYPLRLPIKYVSKYIAFEDTIHKFKDSTYFAYKYVNKKPVSSKRYKASKSNFYSPITENNKNLKKLYYIVKQGDNLGYISKWYNVPIRKIKMWNGLHSNFIKAGQKLTIYVPKKKYSHYKKINSMTFAQKQKLIGQNNNTAFKQKNNTTKDDKYIYYKVKKGDNFWTIAKKFPGVSNYDIMKLNNIKDERSLRPGQLLKIKKIN